MIHYALSTYRSREDYPRLRRTSVCEEEVKDVVVYSFFYLSIYLMLDLRCGLQKGFLHVRLGVGGEHRIRTKPSCIDMPYMALLTRKWRPGAIAIVHTQVPTAS